jgi:hypothetical protein
MLVFCNDLRRFVRVSHAKQVVTSSQLDATMVTWTNAQEQFDEEGGFGRHCCAWTLANVCISRCPCNDASFVKFVTGCSQDFACQVLSVQRRGESLLM